MVVVALRTDNVLSTFGSFDAATMAIVRVHCCFRVRRAARALDRRSHECAVAGRACGLHVVRGRVRGGGITRFPLSAFYALTIYNIAMLLENDNNTADVNDGEAASAESVQLQGGGVGALEYKIGPSESAWVFHRYYNSFR